MISSGPSVRGIVGGDHHQVSQLGGHRPHEGALAPVPVSAAAEHADHAGPAVKSRAVVRMFSRASGVWA